MPRPSSRFGAAGAPLTHDYAPTVRRPVENGLFERLPPTFSVCEFDRIGNRRKLFPAEHDCSEQLFGLLDGSSVDAITELSAPLREVERKTDSGG